MSRCPDIEDLEREYDKFIKETCKCQDECDCQTFEKWEEDYIKYLDQLAEERGLDEEEWLTA